MHRILTLTKQRGMASWMGLMALSLAMAAGAQDAPTPNTIVAEGTATVDAMPDYVEFWLQKTASGANHVEAVKGAVGFADQVANELDTRQLKPDRSQAADISIADINQPVAKTAVMLRFSMSPYTTADDGPEQFAAFCDTIRALADAVTAQLEGPVFGVTARDTMQDSAITRALEQALPPAEAAARIMQTRIQSVDGVEILNVAWNRELDSRAPQPQIRRVTCTARVRVRYVFVAA